MELVHFEDQNENIILNRGILSVAHISDLHFGAMNPKLQYEILDEQFLNKIEDIPLDAIVVDGDLFDHKAMANSDLIMYSVKFVDKLVQISRNKKCTIILLAGTYNHDCGQLKLFYHYMIDPTVDVRVVENIQFEYIKGAKILCIPELYGVDESIYRSFLFEQGCYDEVFMHGTIKGAVVNNEVGNGRLFTIDDFVFCKGPIISGHIHNGGCYNKYFYYCGSPYSWRFDDDYRKGFFIVLHNLDTHNHFVHKEEIVSFRYETINLDDMVSVDPKVIIDYIDKLKKEKGIDYIRVEFSKELPEDTKYMIDSFFRNNNNVKLNYKFTKEQKFIQDRLQEMNELEKYSYIFDNSLSEYDKLAKYINDDMNSIFISGEEIKKIIEEEF
ncbi:metallophosphoesterase [uncultured Clostridium sp.]|uniref:metallophosphoesterase family protein n=1 Tax=uncultured Clostridium sp. TaxID=59620 RepID=UPI00263B6AA1|nr:metallophosphoesterase [uncultured Clostridium sp.]